MFLISFLQDHRGQEGSKQPLLACPPKWQMAVWHLSFASNQPCRTSSLGWDKDKPSYHRHPLLLWPPERVAVVYQRRVWSRRGSSLLLSGFPGSAAGGKDHTAWPAWELTGIKTNTGHINLRNGLLINRLYEERVAAERIITKDQNETSFQAFSTYHQMLIL